MKFTNSLNIDLNFLQNVKIEEFTSLPTHTPADKSRLISVVNPGSPEGLYIGGTSAWIFLAGIGAANFGDLNDVDLTGLVDGQGVVFNQTSGNWEPTGIATNLGALSDVNIAGATTGQVLTRNGSGIWVPTTPGGGGGGNILFQEILTVSATNTIGNLSQVPVDGNAVMLFINGQLRPNGVDYNIVGQNVNWIPGNPSGLNVLTTDRVIAFYGVAGSGGAPILESPTITQITNPVASLSQTPSDPNSVLLFLSGQARTPLVDYNITPTGDINWISGTVSIALTDTLTAYYQT